MDTHAQLQHPDTCQACREILADIQQGIEDIEAGHTYSTDWMFDQGVHPALPQPRRGCEPKPNTMNTK